MPETKRQKERLVALLVIGVLAMNYPVLSLFSKIKQCFTIPVLYLYIFICWAVFILCVAIVMELPPSPLDRLKMTGPDRED
jgi:hypothetical protein